MSWGEPCGAEQFPFSGWGHGLLAHGSPRAGVVQAWLQVPGCVSLAPRSTEGLQGEVHDLESCSPDLLPQS